MKYDTIRTVLRKLTSVWPVSDIDLVLELMQELIDLSCIFDECTRCNKRNTLIAKLGSQHYEVSFVGNIYLIENDEIKSDNLVNIIDATIDELRIKFGHSNYVFAWKYLEFEKLNEKYMSVRRNFLETHEDEMLQTLQDKQAELDKTQPPLTGDNLADIQAILKHQEYFDSSESQLLDGKLSFYDGTVVFDNAGNMICHARPDLAGNILTDSPKEFRRKTSCVSSIYRLIDGIYACFNRPFNATI